MLLAHFDVKFKSVTASALLIIPGDAPGGGDVKS
jgi:hypothetical protein